MEFVIIPFQNEFTRVLSYVFPDSEFDKPLTRDDVIGWWQSAKNTLADISESKQCLSITATESLKVGA